MIFICLSFVTQIPFFEDVGCMTLQYMDSLFQQDNLQKSKFFKEAITIPASTSQRKPPEA